MLKKILLFLTLVCQLRSFAFDFNKIKNKNIAQQSVDSGNTTAFPMLRFSYYLSSGIAVPTGRFASSRIQNTTAFLQGYDGFGAQNGPTISTGFYFYFKKVPLPPNQKLGINWTMLDISIMKSADVGGINVVSSNPGLLYSYCPRKHMAIDATASLCLTKFGGDHSIPFIIMQEIGIAMRMRLLYCSISFKNAQVNGTYDTYTSPDLRNSPYSTYIGSSKTTISKMSFNINYFSLKLGICF